jgi:RNA ligase (TIGR02306 family)
MKLASIEIINNILPIVDTDELVIVTILSWQVIVKKNQYKIGDYCIYIPIDTIVDPTCECFKFLADSKNPVKKFKVDTIKINGLFSQGLVIPILHYSYEPIVGTDVSEFFGVLKYEKQSSKDDKIGKPFPIKIISKTDESNLNNNPKLLLELNGKESYMTLKMDGTSLTVINNKEEFIICSRNLIVEEDNYIHKFVNMINLKKKITDASLNIAIQGELCGQASDTIYPDIKGPIINGNQMGLSHYKLYIFTIKNLDTNEYYGMYDIKNLCSILDLEMVPIVDIFTCDTSYTLTKFQDIANTIQYTTDIDKKVPGEGIVIRPVKPIVSKYLQKCLSFKVISQHYKD